MSPHAAPRLPAPNAPHDCSAICDPAFGTTNHAPEALLVFTPPGALAPVAEPDCPGADVRLAAGLVPAAAQRQRSAAPKLCTSPGRATGPGHLRLVVRMPAIHVAG